MNRSIEALGSIASTAHGERIHCTRISLAIGLFGDLLFVGSGVVLAMNRLRERIGLRRERDDETNRTKLRNEPNPNNIHSFPKRHILFS